MTIFISFFGKALNKGWPLTTNSGSSNQCSPYQEVTGNIYCLQPLEGLLKLTM